MDLFGIEPSYRAAKLKPFIRNERYIKSLNGKRRRLAKHQGNRQWYRVGYPELRVNRETKQLYYEIWETRGGVTYEEAVAYMDVKLGIFINAMDFYKKYGRLPQ
jgi:hypothetical protein